MHPTVAPELPRTDHLIISRAGGKSPYVVLLKPRLKQASVVLETCPYSTDPDVQNVPQSSSNPLTPSPPQISDPEPAAGSNFAPHYAAVNSQLPPLEPVASEGRWRLQSSLQPGRFSLSARPGCSAVARGCTRLVLENHFRVHPDIRALLRTDRKHRARQEVWHEELITPSVGERQRPLQTLIQVGTPLLQQMYQHHQ